MKEYEKFLDDVLDQTEIEYKNPLRIKEKRAFVLGAAFAYGYLGCLNTVELKEDANKIIEHILQP